MKRLLCLLVCLLPLPGTAATVAELAPWLDSLPENELRRQLDSLPDPSATDEQGRTLLHHAVCGAPDMVPLLLEQGVDPAVGDKNDATALHRFFRCGHTADNAALDRVVPALLNAGAPIQGRDSTIGAQPLHLALAAIPAEPQAVDIYRDAARLLLARGAPVEKADDRGRSPLHFAATRNVPHLVNVMVDAGAPIDAQDAAGRTPLWLAAQGRHNLATFEALLAAGTDPALHPEDAASVVARTAASRAWRKLDLLLQLVPEQSLVQADATAVLATALWEDAPLPVAERIHAAGAAIPSLMEHGGGDLAWRLATRQRPRTLDWLIGNGFPLNELPPSGYPPLYFAPVDAARLLLERGADPALPSAQDGTVMAAFIKPPERLRPDAPHFNARKVDLLLEADYPLDLRDPQGMTALERAVRGNRLWLVEKLLAAGADPTLTSDEQASVVPYALPEGRLPMIRTLIGAIPDFPQRHAGLLLSYLKQGHDNAAVAELLILRGSDVHATDGRGNPPLLWAARNEQWPIVSLLLDNGARRQHTNANGCDLDCYVWKMPASLKQRLRGDGRTTWQDRLPRLDDRPAAFFAVAMIPALALYLLMLAWRLHHHRSLWRLSLDLTATLLLTVLVASMLFYRCQDCVLPTPNQLPATALVALLVFLALRAWRR